MCHRDPGALKIKHTQLLRPPAISLENHRSAAAAAATTAAASTIGTSTTTAAPEHTCTSAVIKATRPSEGSRRVNAPGRTVFCKTWWARAVSRAYSARAHAVVRVRHRRVWEKVLGAPDENAAWRTWDTLLKLPDAGVGCRAAPLQRGGGAHARCCGRLAAADTVSAGAGAAAGVPQQTQRAGGKGRRQKERPVRGPGQVRDWQPGVKSRATPGRHGRRVVRERKAGGVCGAGVGGPAAAVRPVHRVRARSRQLCKLEERLHLVRPAHSVCVCVCARARARMKPRPLPPCAHIVSVCARACMKPPSPSRLASPSHRSANSDCARAGKGSTAT